MRRIPIAAGAPAPDFELESQTGELLRLAAGRGSGSLVLYFMRAFT